MTDSVGQEALTQKGPTPLYTELTEVISEARDLLKENLHLTVKKQIECLHLHDFETKILAVIKEHTNFHFKQVFIEPVPYLNLMFLFRVATDDKKKIHFLGQLTATFQDAYNDKISHMNEEVYSKYVGLMDISLVISIGVLTKQTKEHQFLLTPEEIAAGLLHEIGHCDYLIRQNFRTVLITAESADFMTYSSDPKNKEQLLAILEKIKQTSDPKYQKVISLLEIKIKDSSSEINHYDTETLDALSFVLIKDTSDKLFPYARGIFTYGTEQMMTMEHIVDEERSADEYAARHGAHAGLVSLVRKLEENTISSMTFGLTDLRGPVLLVNMLNFFLAVFDSNADAFSLRYDPIIRRMELNVETAKHAFSNLQLEEAVKKEIHQDILYCEDYLKKIKSHPFIKQKQNLQTWKTNMERFGRLLKSPFDLRLSEDYEKLQSSTQKLSRHNLHYIVDLLKR